MRLMGEREREREREIDETDGRERELLVFFKIHQFLQCQYLSF